MNPKVSIFALENFPEIKKGDDLSKVIIKCVSESKTNLNDGDVICIAQKVVSKAEGCIYNLDDMQPSEEAITLSKKLNKDPRKIEIILKESKNVIRAFKHKDQNEGVIICEHKLGFISANAAVDESNTGESNTVITLPKDPDLSAKKISDYIFTKLNVNVGIVITDTFGRPWRLGQVNVAIGLNKVPATIDEKGKSDISGRSLKVTEPAFADEIAAASGLVIKKDSKTPVVILQGLIWKQTDSKSKDLIRKVEEDMFR
ncbi:MAG: coenzyme F420-0:L-glutamate ligase [SAR116 cluster bacterium]|nr:coenzyme F420-0:L-glutamate ligase [SAR116 cluster bacterium]